MGNESASYLNLKRKKDKKIVYGWDVFNQNTLYKAYDKRLKKLKLTGIIKNKDELVKRAKQNMIKELKENIKQRNSFQRRRCHYENEQVSWINKRNEIFNRKVSRAFDKYTTEIKANLERNCYVKLDSKNCRYVII